MTPYIPPVLCHVNHVIDGDTLECDKLRIRLCAIDTPEKFQLYGASSTAKLTQLALNKNVRLVNQCTDIYGRIIAEVWLNNRLLNAEMLREGLAYSYGSCPMQKTVLINAEKSAAERIPKGIANKFGVWQSEQIKPWIYRKRSR
jgi:micrococcal nuclease